MSKTIKAVVVHFCAEEPATADALAKAFARAIPGLFEIAVATNGARWSLAVTIEDVEDTETAKKIIPKTIGVA